MANWHTGMVWKILSEEGSAPNGGFDLHRLVAGSFSGEWSWVGDLTLIRRKRTLSLNLSWLLISCTTPNLSNFFSLSRKYLSIHLSISTASIHAMHGAACCGGLWCGALTELRVLINGSALGQNLVIGDWLSLLFLFFPPRYPLTDLWLKREHGSAMSSELVSNLELTAARSNTLDTFSADLSHITPEEGTQTEAGRVCWCLFVNSAGTAS